MAWLRVHIELDKIDPTPVEQALLELGALAIEFSDAADDAIFEPAPGTTPLWPTLQMSALFDANIDGMAIRLAVAGATNGEPAPSLQFESVAEQDWIKNWQQDLQPMRFGKNLWICPTGSPCPNADGIIVELNPGLAFGTGSHATTSLCLDWLTEHVHPGNTVLDYGCGSGILSVAALALGAGHVLGIDIDDQALRATRDNAMRNRVAERLNIARPEAACDERKFDRLVANILSGTLIELATKLRGYCRTGTEIALSGILTHQTESVMAAYESWVEFAPPSNRDEWTLLTGTVTST